MNRRRRRAPVPCLILYCFDPRRYDLARVGRYKINKKLGLVDRLAGQTLAADVINPYTGEVMAVAGQQIDRAEAERLQASGINEAEVVVEEGTLKIFGNNFVDLEPFVDFDLKGNRHYGKSAFPDLYGDPQQQGELGGG